MTTHEMTASELEQRWLHARKVFLRRMSAMAIFMILAFVFLAVVLQKQQNDADAYIQLMCEQRAINARKTNANWDALAEIEKRNKFIDEDIRQARLAVYRNAHIIIPECRS